MALAKWIAASGDENVLPRATQSSSRTSGVGEGVVGELRFTCGCEGVVGELRFSR